MSYSIDLKDRAVTLRQQGYSVKEIAKILNIAQGTSSVWLRDVELDEKALQRLDKRRNLGRLKASNTLRKKGLVIREKFEQEATNALGKMQLDNNLYKLLTSILFWTEGGKFTDSYVYFMNSDPMLIEMFLKLIRSAFLVDEKKFRALIHIHNYHNEADIKKFWSEKTKIPLSQFYKSYLKQNTQKRIRIGYQGCISIRYYDYRIALELRSFYNAFAKII